MKTTNEKIATIQREGYDLDFGTVFNNALENFKKIALMGGLALFLFMMIFGAIACSAFVVIIGSANFAENFAAFKVENFSVTGIISYLVGTILFAGLMSPFMAGIIKMARAAARQEEVAIGFIFDYYKSPYFGQLFIATVLIAFFSNTFSVVSEIAGYQFIGVLMSMLVSFLTFLTIPLIVFGDLKALDAIKGSMIIVSKQPLTLMGLLIVSVLFCFIGLIALCIGIFFTLPFIYSMYYCIYDAVIGDEDADLASSDEAPMGWS